MKKENLRKLVNGVSAIIMTHLQDVKDLDIAVLCVMGPYKSGKSFYLNFMRLYLDYLESSS